VLLQSLAGPGTTDLLILPMSRINGYFPFVVWATDVPGGFADEQVGRLQQIMPPMAAVFEVRLARRVTSDLLRVYLGREAGPKVLAGGIRRGQGERRQAVIMAVDLRRSTWLSDHLPALTMIELLDACFEQICQPVLAEGGDILKFIGDGVLAVFPVGDDATQATCAALTASAAALAGLVQVTRERPDFLLRSPVAGIGLHRGDVFYGNVGAAERLDFTVIGPAVNLAFRIETLTKLLGRPLLLSAQVAASTVPAPVSLGLHSVRGLDEPIEVFAPADRAL
jgi:adenylate cyclase